MTIPTIQPPSSQDVSAYYLAKIYQQLSTQPNGSQASIPPIFSDHIDGPFTPPTSAIWVNGLFFLSLFIGLIGALLATLVQQWSRGFLKGAYPCGSPHKQARLRAYFLRGITRIQLSQTIEAIPRILHISLFLFLTGLSVLITNLKLSVFKILAPSAMIAFFFNYILMTFSPFVQTNSPISTPFSALLYGSYLFFQYLLRFMPGCKRRHPGNLSFRSFLKAAEQMKEQIVLNLNSDIDHESLWWTFKSLEEDTELEKFFERLPRLRDSEIGNNLNVKQGFIIPHKNELSRALIGLMDRTLSSNLVTEFVKQRRMIICAKNIESTSVTSLLEPRWILSRVLFGNWYRFLGCIEFGLLVQNWSDIDNATSFFAQCVAALTTSMVRRDEHWIRLASGLLVDVPKSLHALYITRGDSILLVNAMFLVRRTVQTYSRSEVRHRSDILLASTRTLEAICKFNVRDTLPELQHEFCHLWNQLVATAKTGQSPHHVLVSTLKNIRRLYIALHENAGAHTTAMTGYNVTRLTTDDRDPVLDNPEFYPECTVGDHRPIPQVLDLQFDEPAPDTTEDAPPTSDIVPVPIPTFPYPPALYPISPVLSHYGAPDVDSPSHSATLLEARLPPSESQLTPSHSSNALRGENVQPLVAAATPPATATDSTNTGTVPPSLSSSSYRF